MNQEALGLIETRGLGGAIKAIRAATQIGQLVIASAEKSDSGRTTVRIEGTWQAVLAALEAGAQAAEQIGELVAMHIVPRGDQNISTLLPYRRFLSRYQTEGKAGSHALPTRKNAHAAKPTPQAPKPTTQPSTKRPASQKPRPIATAAPVASPSRSPEPPAPAVADDGAANPTKLSRTELETMSVVNLRRLARTVKGLPIQGRQISMANRQQLIDAIGSVIRLA